MLCPKPTAADPEPRRLAVDRATAATCTLPRGIVGRHQDLGLPRLVAGLTVSLHFPDPAGSSPDSRVFLPLPSHLPGSVGFSGSEGQPPEALGADRAIPAVAAPGASPGVSPAGHPATAVGSRLQ